MTPADAEAFLTVVASLTDSLRSDGTGPDLVVLNEAVARVEAVLCDTFCHRAEGADACLDHRVIARTAVYAIADLLTDPVGPTVRPDPGIRDTRRLADADPRARS